MSLSGWSVVPDRLYGNGVVEGGRYAGPAHRRPARVGTGVGPSRGDGPTPLTGGGNRMFPLGGDLLDVHGDMIHGGATGIRGGPPAGAGEPE